MVKFYREATMSDFNRYENNCILPKAVQAELQQSGSVVKAAEVYGCSYGKLSRDIKIEMHKYLAFAQAKHDLIKGHMVYTEYFDY